MVTVIQIPRATVRRLAQARKLAGLSPRALSLLSGNNTHHVSALEAARLKSPGWPAVVSVCEVLGVSLDWVAWGRGEEPTPEQVRAAVEAAKARRPSVAA